MACDLFMPLKMFNRTGIFWSFAGTVRDLAKIDVSPWILTFWGPLLDYQHNHLISSALPLRIWWAVLELLQSLYMVSVAVADLILGDSFYSIFKISWLLPHWVANSFQTRLCLMSLPSPWSSHGICHGQDAEHVCTLVYLSVESRCAWATEVL